MHGIYTKKALFVHNLLLIGSSEREEDLLGEGEDIEGKAHI